MIVADDRENDLLLHKLYVKYGDRSQTPKGLVQVKRLISADYVIGDIGIEAKEINDLYRSILGMGRKRTIMGQLYDLQESFESPMLVVYNTKLKPFVRGGDRRAIAIEMKRMERTIKQFKMNFHILFPKIDYMQLDTMNDFVELLGNTHTQMKVLNKLAQNQMVKNATSMTKEDERVMTLAALPGITPIMAKDILCKFGSIPNLLRARTSQKSIMEVKGMGRKKAKMILSLRDKWDTDVEEK